MEIVVVKRSTARRRFSNEFKRQIVAQCGEPGASVSSIALANGLNANQVFKWRRQYLQRPVERSAPAELLPVHVVEAAQREVGPASSASPARGHIEIKLPHGQVRIEGDINPEALRVVMQCLLR